MQTRWLLRSHYQLKILIDGNLRRGCFIAASALRRVAFIATKFVVLVTVDSAPMIFSFRFDAFETTTYTRIGYVCVVIVTRG